MNEFCISPKDFSVHGREWQAAQSNHGISGYPCGENTWWGGLSVRWGGELNAGDVIRIETFCDAPAGITLEHTGFFVREI